MSHSISCSLALFVATTLPQDQRRILPAAELREYVLAVLDSYPRDGSHAYWWPRGSEAPKGWIGNSKDLHYGGALLYPGDARKRGYCCGLTFEVFFEAWRRATEARGEKFRIAGLDANGVHALRRAWFGAKIGDPCIRDALVERGLGFEIEDRRRARPGDFVQLWRTNGSGHSVIFLRWIWGLRATSSERPPRPAIVGLEYWSTQKSTRGIGVRREYFVAPGDPRGTRVPTKPRKEKPSERRVCPDSTYIVRAGSRPKSR